MNKKMKELLAKIESKTILAKSYMEDGEGKDVEKATAIIKEIDDLQREYDTEQKLYELSKKDNGSKVTELGTKAKTDSDPIDSTKAFADMARSGFKTKGMSENVDEDGGYIVPEDIQTRINQYRKNTSAIITNDDGLDWLDNLEDKNGRPLLNPDPTDSAKLQLRCGATVVPIKVIPNKTLKSNGTKVPMIIGDLKEAVKYWDRQQTSIKTSDVASIGEYNAFAQNSTLFRAIEREDITAKDFDAFVYGYVNLGE